MITWLSTKDEIGSASLYASNITLNTVAMNKFVTAYRVMVGIDDDRNIILAPLDKDRVLRGDLKEEQLQKVENLIETAVSIAKISNISKKEVTEMLDILYEEE